jgi:hypothetical protein
MTAQHGDRQILRDLAGRVMQIACLPVQDESRALWKKLNSLQPVRPLVWINEIPWWEMQDEELRCQCEDEFARGIEGQRSVQATLRRALREVALHSAGGGNPDLSDDRRADLVGLG